VTHFDMQIGNVQVITTDNMAGHPPEFYAQQMIDKIIYIADGVGGPIRDQAVAFRDEIYSMLVKHVAKIQQAERARLIK